MKKLSKVVLAASMFAALFAGCSNGLVANDTLDAPDVDITATESGVIVLEWDAVKDADAGYEVYVKTPYSEKFVKHDGLSTTVGGIYRYIYADVSEADSEYSFKVVAKTSKVNLLSSETEVSVDTPEAFKEATLDASKIAFSLRPRTANAYDISFPVDYGYDYELLLTRYTDDAKAIFVESWVNTNPVSENIPTEDWEQYDSNGNGYIDSGDGYRRVETRISVNGAGFVLESKENDNGDEVQIAPVVGSIHVPDSNGEKFYIVAKATPKNTKLSSLAKQYVISTNSVSYTDNGIRYPNSSSTSLTDENVTSTATSVTTKITIKFSSPKINGQTAVAASKYKIACIKTTTSRDTAKFVSSISKTLYTKAVEDDTEANATAYYNNYKFVETVTEAEAAGTVETVYRFDYYILFEDDDGNTIWVYVDSYNPYNL